MHRILFRMAALSGEVRISYTFDVIRSLPVPEPNSLLWMSNAGITSSCVVIDSFVVSRINVFVSSSSKSSQGQISSIFCLSALRRVSFGLTPRKNPMLASFWELNFSIFRNDKFARSVSMIPSDEEYLDPYFICDRVNSDSSVKDIYTRLVILQILWFGKVMLCSLSVGKVLLLVILLFS